MNRLDSDQNVRLKKLIRKTVTFLSLGIVYFFIVTFTGFGIPCLFSAVTGKQCAGCGITRMFISLARLDIQSAVRYNAFVLFLLLPGLLWGIYRGWIYVKSGKTSYSKTESVCLIIVFVLTIIFSVARNL